MTEVPSSDAIAAAFELGRPTGHLTPVAAQSHTMWRLETERGAFAVKQLNRDYNNPNYIDWFERAFLLELAAYEAGVSMPRPVPVPGTRRCVAELPGETKRPVAVRVHEWVDRVNATRLDVTPEMATAVGRMIGQIHALNMTSGERMLEMFPIPEEERWAQHVNRGRREGAPWLKILEELLPVISEMELLVQASIDDGQPLILAHRDVHPKNVLVTPSGELLLIDWDGSAPWPSSHEIASVAIEWAGSDFGDPDKRLVHAMLQGYRDAGGSLSVPGPSIFGGFFCILLNWLEYNVRRALGERLRTDADREIGAREMTRLGSLLPRFVGSVDAWAEMLGRPA